MKHTRRWAPLILLLLVLIPFWDLLSAAPHQVIGGGAAGNDLTFMFLNWWDFALESVRNGEFPLWNPYLYAGTPFVANPQPALFYPPVWVIAALPLTRAVTALYLLHLWIAALGMYRWLADEVKDDLAAYLGALVFAFSGYFFTRIYAGHIGVVMTQAWLPWILWAYRRAARCRRWPVAALGGLPVGLALLAGHTASFFYVALVWGIYILYTAWPLRDARRFLKHLRPAAGMGAVGLGLAAVQLLPTLQYLALSTRQEAGYAFASGYAWPASYLLTLLIPGFFGTPTTTGYWGDGVYEELIFYVGLLPLLLAFLVGRGKRQRLRPWLIGLSVGALLLALGGQSSLHRLLYNFVPLFRVARAPARAGYVFTFAVAALCALNVAWAHQRPAPCRKQIRRLFRGPLPWLVVGLALLVILGSLMLFTLQRDLNPDVGRFWHLANSAALFLLLFLLSWGLLRRWSALGRWGTLLAAGLVLIDLWGFGRGLVALTPVAPNAYWTQVDALVAEFGEGRVLSWGLGIFEHNQGLPLRVESVFAYDPLQLDRHHGLTTSLPDPRARAYDLLHARYLVTHYPLDYPDGAPETPRLLAQREGLWFYERPNTLPRAWLVHTAEVYDSAEILTRINDPDFDPQTTVLLEALPPCELTAAQDAGAVTWVARRNNTLDLIVETSAPGMLVLSEVYYPGWRAAIDGESTPVLEANYALRALCLPEGRHHVRLFFRPPLLWIGAGITLLSLGALAVAFWQLRRGSRRA